MVVWVASEKDLKRLVKDETLLKRNDRVGVFGDGIRKNLTRGRNFLRVLVGNEL